MDHGFPVYTSEAVCQDCYKCVRQCPVKAIRINNGHASVLPQLCISCAQCVEICPGHAKKVRDDSGRARLLLQRKSHVFASLAPSWTVEFPGVSANSMIAALRQLGFAGVSETALGAQEVSTALNAYLPQAEPGVYISTACPVVVDFVCKYAPHAHAQLLPMSSPLLAHCRLLRQQCGEEIGIVFFGPCIAKKHEADRQPDLLDLALTFQDLRQWLTSAHIEFSENAPDANFVPYQAEEGRIYPIDGGMINTLAADSQIESVAISGLRHLQYYLRSDDLTTVDRPVFIEALACEGGCINGPGRSNKRAGLAERLHLRQTVELPRPLPARENRVEVMARMAEPEPVAHRSVSDEAIRQALRDVGKYTPDDELNCGGCGYETCRAFARAMVEDRAEPAMCVSFMREKARRKANALLRCMPSASVIVDASLQIIECNRHFAELFGSDALLAYEARPGLEGAYLDRIVPFVELFRMALETGKDIHRDLMRMDDLLLNVTLFTIEPEKVVGCIIQDVTEFETHREQIACKANEVLQKNLATVQEIACKLGEHMADTEILLRSISRGFARTE